MRNFKRIVLAAAAFLFVLIPATQVFADITTTLSVTKQVRNVSTVGSFSELATARAGEWLEFEIRVKNTGTMDASSVAVADGFSNTSGVVGARQNLYVSRAYNGVLPNATSINFAFATLEANGEIMARYSVQASSITASQAVSCNTASASASNASNASDTACVTVLNSSTATATTTLTISKQVRNVTQNSAFSTSITARGTEMLEYEIRVKNTGSQTASNVVVSDVFSNPQYVTGKINYSVNKAYSGNLDSGSGLSVSLLEAGAELVVRYQVQLNNYYTQNNVAFCNTAGASSGNAQYIVAGNTCVTLQANLLATSVSVSRAVRAQNDTKNKDATLVAASREDFITYTLTTTNSGNTNATDFVVTTDVSGILPLADMVDAGGGFLNGNTLTYPAMTIVPGSSVSKQFRVRVKYFLPAIKYVLTNSHGNALQVSIDQGATATNTTYTAPATGANMTFVYALVSGLFSVLGAAVVFHKGLREKLFA